MVVPQTFSSTCPIDSDDEIVISGISGKFPNSRNITELSDNLYKNVYMANIYKDRIDPICPKRICQISGVEKFDAKFFGIDEKLANILNPSCRLLMEVTVEAFLDAGINPNSLRGTNTGVFLGYCGAENAYEWYYYKYDTNGLGLLGNLFHSLPDYLSYVFGINGPSVQVDAACSSTGTAINHAISAIQTGICDIGIVGGASLLFNPNATFQFAELGTVAPEGISKPFDDTADGFVRAEAISIIILQKQKTAKRKYATILHSKLNSDGYKIEGITHPSISSQQKLMTEFYQDINFEPINVDYIEAHCTSTIVGDPIECKSIGNVFCKGISDQPLLIGSVKSNLGHTEGCSTMCSIAKILLSFENHLIPANINLTKYNRNISEFTNNKLKVCSENFEFNGRYAAMNSFGIGGANFHTLLRKNSKEKHNFGIPNDSLPRLINLCGQSNDTFIEIFNTIESRPLDSEFIGLIHSIYSSSNDNSEQYGIRGFGIFQNNSVTGKATCLTKQYKNLIKYQRPITLILHGIDEWLLIGLRFIEIESFRKSMDRSHEFLLNFGFNLNKIFRNVNSNAESNSLNLYRNILIIVCQIAFIDMLKYMSVPIHFYSANDAISSLAAEYAENSTKFENILRIVYFSCVYGDSKIIKEISQTQFVIPNSSYKWLKNVKQKFGKLPSKLLPKNSIIVEICKHTINQLNKDSTYHLYLSPVLNESTSATLVKLLNVLGQLFILGVQMDISKLYPPISYPVSRNTQMISPLLRWDHSNDYYVSNARANLVGGRVKGVRKCVISLVDLDYKCFEHHVIDGRILLPATGYLLLVWETFAMLHNKYFSLINVEFNHVRLQRATVLNHKASVTLNVSIHLGTGEFLIYEGNTIVVTGNIKLLTEQARLDVPISPFMNQKYWHDTTDNDIINQNDFYKSLRIRGYEYGPNFQSILWANFKRICGYIKCQQNWVQFLDGLLQVGIITKDVKSMMLPTYINKLSIDVPKHIEAVDKCSDNNFSCVTFEYNMHRNELICGGVKILQPKTITVNRRKTFKHPILEVYKFIPNFSKTVISQYDAIQIILQMVIEKTQLSNLKIVEIDDDFSEQLIIEFEKAIDNIPILTSNLILLSLCSDISSEKIVIESKTIDAFNECDVIIVNNFLCESDMHKNLQNSLKKNGLIVSAEDDYIKDCPNDLQICSVITLSNKILHILQVKTMFTITRPESFITISEQDSDLNWLEKLKTEIKNDSVIIVSEKEPTSGIIGLVNCIRKEQIGKKVTCVFIDDSSAPTFNPSDPFYTKQLDLCLPFNIYRNGEWGTYKHVQLLQDIVLMPQKTHCFVNITEPGDLSKLAWYSGPLTECNENEEKIVRVQYGAINFRDVLLATGRLNIDVFNSNRLTSNYILGYEFAGINKNGKRIMGMCNYGGMGSHVTPIENLSWEIPDDWSLKDAASCSLIYATVYYSFFWFKPIAKGKTILIHAGSGGIGLAAIRVALCYGMKVFTTVSNAEKRKFLLDTYPGLKENHIGNSRDLSFVTMIKERTNGRGVDYVLNSLSDEKLLASINCLGRGGVFLEIGRVDLMNDTNVKLALFQRNIQFCPVMLDKIFISLPEETCFIYKIMADDIKAGIIQPIFNKECNVNELQNVFRFMGTAKHIGKIVLKIREQPSDEYTVPLEVIPCIYFDSKYVYIILGGLGGFGLELVDWMIIRGARKFVLCSRSGITQSYQTFCISNWKKYGVQIKISQSNIDTRNGCEKLILEGKTIGDIGGIFNLAVVLQDALLENQSVEKFMAVLKPKSLATKHLDELSRKLCPTLKHFVVFSSLSCGRGNAGQTNYGMANSIMERVVEQRIIDGLPGKAIQWGAIGDVGVVAEMTKGKTNIEISGSALQPISSCLSILDKLLTVPDAVVASMIVTEKRKMKSNQSAFDLALYAIGIQDVSKVSMNATLSEVGMDSVVATEIRAICEREADVTLSSSDLATLTLHKLKTILETGSSK